MSGDAELLRRACATFERYFELGNETSDHGSLRVVQNRAHPDVWDANHASRVRASGASEIARALATLDERCRGLGHRDVRCDPFTPVDFEAELVLRGFRPRATLQLLLEGPLQAASDPLEIRAARSEADWREIARLMGLEDDEAAEKFSRPRLGPDVRAGQIATQRAKGPDLKFWIARIGGEDCGYFSSWPGENGVGMVENLFTHPTYRLRGVARALIAEAVRDARARGAGPVLIGAHPDDTPGRLYRALGFRPLCVTRAYHLEVG